MRRGILAATACLLALGSQAQALDLDSVLGTIGGGTGGGLPVLGDSEGIALDGLAEVKLLGSTVISSNGTTPLVAATVLDTPTDEGQTIARVTVGGDDILGDGGIPLGDLLGGDLLGGDLLGGDLLGGGEGDLVGGVVDTVTGLVGGDAGGDLLGGDLVGGVVDTVTGVVGGGDGGLAGGDLVGGVVDTVGDVVGGLTGGL